VRRIIVRAKSTEKCRDFRDRSQGKRAGRPRSHVWRDPSEFVNLTNLPPSRISICPLFQKRHVAGTGPLPAIGERVFANAVKGLGKSANLKRMTSRSPPPKRSSARRRWPADQVERLGSRFENGETARQIAESVGVTKSAIWSLLWRHGYVRGDPNRW
jgi:hypothetical protein